MFDFKSHLINLKGKEYLPVAARLLWFRTDRGDSGSVVTELMSADQTVAIFKATVLVDGVVVATGHGTCVPSAGPNGRYIEKAETAAIGRALAAAGYGTQFGGNEFSEGDNLADAPVEARYNPKDSAPAASARPSSELDHYLPKAERPWQPEMLKSQIAVKVKHSKYVGEITTAQRGTLAKVLNDFFLSEEEPDKFRHTLLRYLVGVDSSTKLSKAQASVLLDWASTPEAYAEAMLIIRAAGMDAGQLSFEAVA